LTRTGQLGAVMQESARIAYSYLRANSPAYFERHLVHLHVPAGATPKDGPSAGITMALALYSLVNSRPVPAGVAMTGEISLVGKVLPVGGIREKIIAARRIGIERVILPIDNRRDFDELPEYLRAGLRVDFVSYFPDVIEAAFGSPDESFAALGVDGHGGSPA
jgi:ATP-dependent Lon protease